MNPLKRLTMMASLLVGLLITLFLSYGSSATPAVSASNDIDPLQIVLDHLDQNRAEYGLVEADLSDYVVTDMYQTHDTGVTHIYLRQRINGLDIWGANLNANVMPDGSILTLNNAFVPQLERSLYSGQPTLTAAEALNTAAEQLRWPITSYFVAEQNLGGVEQMQILNTAGVAVDPVPARLIYFLGEDGRLNLAWEAIVQPIHTSDWWQLALDAHTGRVLEQFNWTVSHNPADIALNDGRTFGLNDMLSTDSGNMAMAMQSPDAVADGSSYRVFALPVESPIHASPPSPADGRVLVTEPADALASPFGWHDTNGAAGAEFTVTRGNNVHAYTDTDNNDTPDPGSDPSGGASLTFDFPLDLTQAPSTYRPASVTNLFYWNNITHDLLYRHGFNEVSGNFQVNNYGRGGLGNDDVRAEGQDGGGTNNANFSTPPDGSRPRMQMYNWTAPNPDRDGDFDAGIVAHEYGHGWSIRITGGPAVTNCLSGDEQMGEGWSDYLSVVFTARTGDTPTTNRGVGTYALNQPTNGPGIRPAPYNTDMGVNSYTYANLPSMAVPHGVGFVWNTMLWEMYWNLVDEHGFNPNLYQDWTTGGNNLALRLVTDGLKLQPCNPGFVDGRNAILAADTALTSGANQCIIWEAFAKRGLGFSALQGSSASRTDGTAAFDMPDTCTGISAAPMSNDICQGSSAVYTVSVGEAFVGNVDFLAVGNPAPSTINFSANPIVAPGSSDMTIGNTAAVSAGNYVISVTGDDGSITDTVDVDLNVFAGAPSQTTLITPAHLAQNVVVPTTFEWSADTNATGYLLQVATDMAFTSLVYSDTVATNTAAVGVLSDTTIYYWRVTPQNICGVGTTSAVFAFRTASPPSDVCNVGDTTVNLFSEGFESGAAGWTTGGTASTWAQSNVRVNSGSFSYLAVNSNTVSDQRLASPAIELTAGLANYTLQFWNHQTIEDQPPTGCYDGAIVEISTDSGANWTQLTSFTHAYDGPINGGFGNPLAGLQAWCGDPRNWHRPVVDVSAYAGETVNLRWRLGTDSSVAREGWYVDDVVVQACQAGPAEYAVEADAPIFAQSGDADTAVTYTVDITNTGTLADSYDVTVDSNEGWTVSVDPQTVTLDPNATTTVEVTVMIPADVDAGTVDTTTATAASQTDLFTYAAVTLATDVNAPEIGVNPVALEATVGVDQTADHTLTLSNSGGSNLDWSITEEPGATGCTGTIPWLSVAPSAGTTLAGGSDDVTVTFDATGYAEGVYTGALCVNSNDPMTPQTTVPVTMTVVAPVYSFEMHSANTAQSGLAGEVMTYTISVTNTGNIMDTYIITLAGHSWATMPSDTSVMLAPGASADMTVVVTIAVDAEYPDTDTTMLTVTSDGDGSVTADMTLTTSVVQTGYTLYLPLIARP